MEKVTFMTEDLSGYIPVKEVSKEELLKIYPKKVTTPTYAFLDVETTGFDSLRNQVITLACYVTDGNYNLLGEHYGEFRPEGAKEHVWTEGAEAVHGISWEKALSFPPVKESCQDFISFLDDFGSLTMVAHNMPYDRRMLKGTFSRYDLHFALYDAFPEQEDTLKLVKDANLVTGKSKSLGPICKELGIEHDHHDARSDAKVLIEIHKRCMQVFNKGSALTNASMNEAKE